MTRPRPAQRPLLNFALLRHIVTNAFSLINDIDSLKIPIYFLLQLILVQHLAQKENKHHKHLVLKE